MSYFPAGVAQMIWYLPLAAGLAEQTVVLSGDGFVRFMIKSFIFMKQFTGVITRPEMVI